MPRTGIIDHIGIGVPDLEATKQYYDELMPILGMKLWFGPFPDGTFAYGPDGAFGAQLFFYPALQPGEYSQHGTGLQHIGFAVPTRAVVREAHAWAVSKGAEILNAPREFPEYGVHYATYWLDPHGFKLEAFCGIPDTDATDHGSDR